MERHLRSGDPTCKASICDDQIDRAVEMPPDALCLHGRSRNLHMMPTSEKGAFDKPGKERFILDQEDAILARRAIRSSMGA
jgi:hypothetical protein